MNVVLQQRFALGQVILLQSNSMGCDVIVVTALFGLERLTDRGRRDDFR